MTKTRLTCFWVLLTFCVQATGIPLLAQGEVLTNDDVLKMVKAGIGDAIIIAKIKQSAARFDLSTDAVIQLKTSGASDAVLESMMTAKSAPPAAAAAPAPPAAPAADSAGAAPVSSQAVQFDDAQHLIKAAGQEKAEPVEGTLVFDPGSKTARFLSNGMAQLNIPYNQITSLLYERAAKPRYGLGLLIAWPLLFTKGKKHFLTIQYNEGGTGQFAILQLHKKNYQMALATIEAQTGIKVDRTEER